MSDTGFLGRLGARLTQTLENSDAEELEKASRSSGADSVCSCSCGQSATIIGRIRCVTYGLGEDELGVTAEVYDGTASVDVVWVGRRAIPGLEEGRCLKVSGRIAVNDNRRVLFNPRYELREDVSGLDREGR